MAVSEKNAFYDANIDCESTVVIISKNARN